MAAEASLGSSFRDPAGNVFRTDGRLLRRVAPSYFPTLDLLSSTGLYDELVQAGLLIPHEEVANPFPETPEGRFLQPELVETISYPYEWCFGQLKAAALVTLEVHARAINKGLALKDATAFNIQFHRGQAVLIDTLSFEAYSDGKPWRAYRQFCEHFLAPLALMALVDARLNSLLKIHLDGIPLDLASKLLPFGSKLNSGLAMHMHLHAKAQKQSGVAAGGRQANFGRTAMLGLVDSLRRTIESLSWEPRGTVWADYYDHTNYQGGSMTAKRELVVEMLGVARPKLLWDLGANTGEFSRLASSAGITTVAWDFDVAAVEKNYRDSKGDERLLPLVVDLTNPSPGIGWANEERDSFIDRCNADAVMALALIHHLAIGNNVPLAKLAEFFARLSPWAILEFVPKSDSQVQRLLATRQDIYDGYTEEGFREAFERCFEVIDRRPITGSERVLYLLRRKAQA